MPMKFDKKRLKMAPNYSFALKFTGFVRFIVEQLCANFDKNWSSLRYLAYAICGVCR